MRQPSRTALMACLSRIMAAICLLGLVAGQAHAVWYEATGQAVVVNGNKEVFEKFTDPTQIEPWNQ